MGKAIDGKNTFKLFNDSVEMLLDEYDDSGVGRLFRMVYGYSVYGVVPNDEALTDKLDRVVFKRFREQADYLNEKYLEKCVINSENRNQRKYSEEERKEYMRRKTETDHVQEAREHLFHPE